MNIKYDGEVMFYHSALRACSRGRNEYFYGIFYANEGEGGGEL